MTVLLDAAGWRRSPATMPGYPAGQQGGMQAATLKLLCQVEPVG